MSLKFTVDTRMIHSPYRRIHRECTFSMENDTFSIETFSIENVSFYKECTFSIENDTENVSISIENVHSL